MLATAGCIGCLWPAILLGDKQEKVLMNEAGPLSWCQRVYARNEVIIMHAP